MYTNQPYFLFFFFNDTATTEIYTLSLHDALPICGAGLVMVEMTCTSPDARITPGCPGLWNDKQAQAFARIVDFVHAQGGAHIGVQLGQAGRKGSTQLHAKERTSLPVPDIDNSRKGLRP